MPASRLKIVDVRTETYRPDRNRILWRQDGKGSKTQNPRALDYYKFNSHLSRTFSDDGQNTDHEKRPIKNVDVFICNYQMKM